MYVALRCAQRCDFILFMGTEPKSSRLNVCVEERKAKAKPSDSSALLGANVVSRLKYSKGDGKLAVFVRSAD